MNFFLLSYLIKQMKFDQHLCNIYCQGRTEELKKGGGEYKEK